MKTERPNLLRILFTDYVAFLAILFPLVMWAILIFDVSTRAATVFYVGIAITVIAVPALLWRIIFFIKMFDSGVETQATITGMSFYRSRGSVHYTYHFEGTQYHARDVIFNIGRVREFGQKQNITALVDPHNPKRAIVRDLYL